MIIKDFKVADIGKGDAEALGTEFEGGNTMLIVSQNRKCLLNMERVGTVFLSSLYRNHEEGKPVKVLASFPLAEDVTETLGEYESEARAMEVLDKIATEYGNFMKVDGGCNPLTGAYTQPFAFVHPKVYRMPEK